MNYDDSAVRHWRFVYQSIQYMQTKLLIATAKIYTFHSEASIAFNFIQENYKIKTIFSHQEIENKITYNVDLTIKEFCTSHSIEWGEYQRNGVIRKLKSRKDWQQR